jgi:lipoyl(octanoyl) transferase
LQNIKHYPTLLLSLQSKRIALDKQTVLFKDMGTVAYGPAWQYQETLLAHNVAIKSALMQAQRQQPDYSIQQLNEALTSSDTQHHLLFCEHPPVYTLGKNGNASHILISAAQMQEQGIEFFNTNRGGDITFHGPGQIVGYPIFDLDKIYTDIGRYLRELEQVIINTLTVFGIVCSRSKGETGVWIEPDIPGKERKICAMGVRCSRWITMHGFALNVNTNLNYFNHIVPCGIANKKVASMQAELGREININEVKEELLRQFELVFPIAITTAMEIA